MTAPAISDRTRALARFSENCLVCRCARRRQAGFAFWLVRTFESLCPFCRAYAKVHGRMSHEPVPSAPSTIASEHLPVMSKPMPKGWNKTVADLFDEMRQGKRLIMTDEEGQWALEYERSLLPANAVFPQQGQLWEARHDCEVDLEVFFAAPGGGPSSQFKLSKGERVRIGAAGSQESLIVQFLPLRYDELENTIVAPHDRANPRYSHYAFFASVACLNEHFRFVRDTV